MTIFMLVLSIMLMVVPVHAQTGQVPYRGIYRPSGSEPEHEFCDNIGEIGEMLVQYREAGIPVHGAFTQIETSTSSPLKEWLSSKARWVYGDSTKLDKDKTLLTRSIAHKQFKLWCVTDLLPVIIFPKKLQHVDLLYKNILKGYPCNMHPAMQTSIDYCK